MIFRNISLIFITLTLISCNDSSLNENQVIIEKSYLDSLISELNKCQKDIKVLKEESEEREEENDDHKLVGQFESFKVNSIGQIIKETESYILEIENLISVESSNPNEYRILNFYNEGKEWQFSGVLNKNHMMVSGTNINNTKRINGSIELHNKSNDSLIIELVIRDNTRRTVKAKDMIEKINEIWIRR